jgi:Holliday junction DNA helicase RuvA
MLEKEWHKLLVTVQGVGAKAAMAILGTLGPEGVSRAIALGDAKAIQAAPGVGPKIAQRVVLELKSKAPTVMAMGANPASMAGAVEDDVIEPISAVPKTAVKPDAGAGARAAASAEALSALINLGYQHGDAAQAVAQAAGDAAEATTGTLIKAALKLLAPKG